MVYISLSIERRFRTQRHGFRFWFQPSLLLFSHRLGGKVPFQCWAEKPWAQVLQWFTGKPWDSVSVLNFQWKSLAKKKKKKNKTAQNPRPFRLSVLWQNIPVELWGGFQEPWLFLNFLTAYLKTTTVLQMFPQDWVMVKALCKSSDHCCQGCGVSGHVHPGNGPHLSHSKAGDWKLCEFLLKDKKVPPWCKRTHMTVLRQKNGSVVSRKLLPAYGPS